MNCFREAAFTKRTTDEDSLEVIGGADKYMAACRTCYKLEDVKVLFSNVTLDFSVPFADLGSVGIQIF